MRVALLSNVTVDLLADMVKKTNSVYISAGFDTWQQEIVMHTSGLYEYNPEAVVILLHADAYEWTDKNLGFSIIDEWCMAFKELTDNLPGVPVFISSIDVNIKCHYGAEIRFEDQIENHLIECVQNLHDAGASIYILPVKDAITDMGRRSFYSDKMWYIGSMPYSIKGLSTLSALIGRYISAAKGMRKKCMAVDLDNTLWGGVIGEDRVEGISLSSHKEGAQYYDTQKILKKMKEQGVMLAILSKNNVEDVEPVFRHPNIILRHKDFAAESINWESKTVNIRKLAKDLNIGLDAFVFLDDNPAEREQMKAECPEVAVIDFPKDSSLLPDTVEQAYNDYFLCLEVTGEDTKKTEMYRAESLRKAEMSAAASVDDFLKNLEMVMTVHRMLPEEKKRVTQLVNKTNQFNVTTRRYSEEEIKSLAENGDIITVHMADKYGDQGLVAVMILKYEKEEAEIDTFLMSCRVMGRKAEEEIAARVKKYLKKKDVKKIRASYIKTAKNTPVLKLFDKLGFTHISGEIRKDGDCKNYLAETDALPVTSGVFKEVSEDWS